jgi:hypothetical protein
MNIHGCGRSLEQLLHDSDAMWSGCVCQGSAIIAQLPPDNPGLTTNLAGKIGLITVFGSLNRLVFGGEDRKTPLVTARLSR